MKDKNMFLNNLYSEKKANFAKNAGETYPLNPFRSYPAPSIGVDNQSINKQYEKSSLVTWSEKLWNNKIMSELKMFVNTKQQFCKSLSVKKG